MAIIQPDPGAMFRSVIEKEVAAARQRIIDKAVNDFRIELEGIATKFAIQVERYYDFKQVKEEVSITLKLPRVC